ncbi:Retrovirus-related Pol polyprotein from transposon TNT 1-94 [Senna tora]|uniref:Retrovirus-related Pol polyprotein from transposon TNT 1-94 n=1 Tax=Senna tora TaxID=362788 RepID=A0A834WRE6_9FABA|nr:Retrovirus-related Pol polyprotein from transposon TNT 1-94 [Senna tora]
MASNLATIPPPSFNGENYQTWVVKMKAHLNDLGLWQWVEGERELPALGNNQTLTQIRAPEEEEHELLSKVQPVYESLFVPQPSDFPFGSKQEYSIPD